MDEKKYTINQIRYYKPGHSGLVQVTAQDLDWMNEGIAEVFKLYPNFIYGTRVARVYRDEMGELFMVDVEHWGSD